MTRVCLSVQLIDLAQVFSSTEVEFLRAALGQPGGSVQAVCVPAGAVRLKPAVPVPVHHTLDENHEQHRQNGAGGVTPERT